MIGVNKCTLIGNVGNDPVIKLLDNGSKVANVSLATSESYKDKNGNKVDSTEWHELEVWGKLADIFEQYVKKGSSIYVEGKIKTDSWENEGVKMRRTKIRVLNMTMLGVKQTEQPQQAPQKPKTDIMQDMESDNLPF